MRFVGFREIYRSTGLMLIESLIAETTVRAVVTQGFGSMSMLEQSGLAWSSFPTKEKNPPNMNPGTIAFKNRRKTRVIEGLIVYSSMAELVQFIGHHIDPTGPGPLSEILASSKRGRGRFEPSDIEEQLETNAAWRRRRRIGFDEINFPIYQYDLFAGDTMMTVFAGGRQVLAWKMNRSNSNASLFALEGSREINGHQVPVLKFIKALRPISNIADHAHEANFFVFDGERVQWAADLDDVSPSLLEEIERDGAMHWGSTFDLLPQDHLEPVALIRLPPREQMKELIPALAGAITSEEPPHPLLSRPGFLLDSRNTVPLHDHLPILDEVEAAVHLLARVTRGIYIPNQCGRAFPVKSLPAGSSYQVLCRPRKIQ